MSWENIIKKDNMMTNVADATELTAIYLGDELNYDYDGKFAGMGFRRHALDLIADAMREGKSDKEIREMLNDEIPDRLERDERFTKRLELHGFNFKDIDFPEAIEDALDPEIEYLSHLRGD